MKAVAKVQRLKKFVGSLLRKAKRKVVGRGVLILSFLSSRKNFCRRRTWRLRMTFAIWKILLAS